MKTALLFGILAIFAVTLLLVSGCSQQAAPKTETPQSNETSGNLTMLKADLVSQGFTVYLVKEGSNDKGSYIDAIYESREKSWDDQVLILKSLLKFFPQKDFYACTEMFSNTETTSFMAYNKIFAETIVGQRAEDVSKNIAYVSEYSSGHWKTTGKNNSGGLETFTLTPEELKIMQYGESNLITTKPLPSAEEVCSTATVEADFNKWMNYFNYTNLPVQKQIMKSEYGDTLYVYYSDDVHQCQIVVEKEQQYNPGTPVNCTSAFASDCKWINGTSYSELIIKAVNLY
jgi:hypothetical protein